MRASECLWKATPQCVFNMRAKSRNTKTRNPPTEIERHRVSREADFHSAIDRQMRMRNHTHLTLCTQLFLHLGVDRC